MAEIRFLGMVDHPNLVKLLGYCGEDHERGIQRLLVYEFMACGSVENHLFRREFVISTPESPSFGVSLSFTTTETYGALFGL